jgi:uncharacterized membrane protein
MREENAVANKTVVLAIFNDEAAADTAADALKKSGVAHHDAIGVLALNEKGEVKTHKMGRRSVGLGIGIGLVLALLSPIGLVVGVVGGGLLGALHHKGLGINQADRDRIGRELQGGKAAVGVLAPVSEANFVADKLTELGGVTETHEVSDEALDEAHAAATADQASTPDEATGTDQATGTPDQAASTDEPASTDQPAGTDQAASTDQG